MCKIMANNFKYLTNRKYSPFSPFLKCMCECFRAGGTAEILNIVNTFVLLCLSDLAFELPMKDHKIKVHLLADGTG